MCVHFMMCVCADWQVAEKYPNIKVNKKSCTIKIYGYQRRFEGADRPLIEHAQMANAFYKAASHRWSELSKLSKTLVCTSQPLYVL